LNENFTEDVRDVFDFEKSVERRGSIGGTSLEMIERQIWVLKEGIGQDT
jgi:argininosuccinate lyase